MSIEILADKFGDFLRSRGGNFENSVGTKSLIVDLAALEGKIGHTSRDHVRRSLRDWRMKLNIKVGVVKYSGGNSLTLKAKVGTLARGIFFFSFQLIYSYR